MIFLAKYLYDYDDYVLKQCKNNKKRHVLVWCSIQIIHISRYLNIIKNTSLI